MVIAKKTMTNEEWKQLTEMREHFKDWEANIPPIPDDASVTLVYSKRDMP